MAIEYDLLIVGSGPIALSVLSKIPHNLSVAVVSHGLGLGFDKDSYGDLSFAKMFGGGLSGWHGVISPNLYLEHFPKKIENFYEFFHRFYPETVTFTNSLTDNSIYVPRKKIACNHLKKIFEEKGVNLYVDEINRLEVNDSFATAISNTEKFRAKKIILAAGAIGTAKLLQQSDLGVVNNYIGNHLNGYADLNISITQDQVKTIFGDKGHIKKTVNGSILNNKYMVYPRPSAFDFRHKKNLSKFKTIYSRKESDVIKNIVKSLSPGLILEAIYNRYGYWFLTNLANNYFQIESNSIYSLDKNFNVVVDEGNLNAYLKNLKINNIFKHADLSTIVSGIHFYNTVKPDDSIGGATDYNSWNNRLIVSDSSTMTSIGGSHHTFSLMAINALAIETIYE